MIQKIGIQFSCLFEKSDMQLGWIQNYINYLIM